MPLQRKSYHLSRLQSELKQHALRTEDEELRAKLWRYYFKAERAENEIYKMVTDAEMRRLLDFIFPNGIPSDMFEDTHRKAPTDDDDDMSPPDDLPKQRGLWD